MYLEIDIHTCHENDIIAENIFDSNHKLLVNKYTKLNSYIKRMLFYHCIKTLKIIRLSSKEEQNHYQFLCSAKTNYEHMIVLLKDILPAIASGNQTGIQKLSSVIEDSVTTFSQFPYLLHMLHEERDYDEYTYSHSLNVGLYSMLLGSWLGYPKKQLKELFTAGLLHDIGKLKIPLSIVNKNGSLDAKEFDLVKKHTIYGYHILKSSQLFSDDICNAVLCHHERLDGSGYPMHYCEKDLHAFAKIIGIADVYDAITTDRIYKKKASPFRAFEILKSEEIKNLDYAYLKLFIDRISSYYIGFDALLQSGEIGKIVYIPPQNVINPIIQIEDAYFDSSIQPEKQIIQIV